MIGAAFLLLVSGTLPAQPSGSALDRHCAQQPADSRLRTQLLGQLMAQVASGTPDQRSLAADTLSCFGEASRDAVPDMIRLFAEPVGEFQANAVVAVARLGQVAVPALIDALGASDLRIRNNASRALARIGPSAAVALPKLKQLAADANPAYSPWAERAIGRILSTSSPLTR
jgi:HEAT repeat protein